MKGFQSGFSYLGGQLYFYQCAALRRLLLLLPCYSLSWCTSRCNSTEFHRIFPYSTGLHISPEIQAWTFNSFCPTLVYQESEESKSVQQTPRSATVLQGISPKPHRDAASQQPPVHIGLCAMHLWPLQKLFPTLLCSPLCPLGQTAQWLHWGHTLGFVLPTLTCQRSEASSSDCLKWVPQCWAPTKHPVGSGWGTGEEGLETQEERGSTPLPRGKAKTAFYCFSVTDLFTQCYII